MDSTGRMEVAGKAREFPRLLDYHFDFARTWKE
jgi:hypothetical protein